MKGQAANGESKLGLKLVVLALSQAELTNQFLGGRWVGGGSEAGSWKPGSQRNKHGKELSSSSFIFLGISLGAPLCWPLSSNFS